MEVVESVAACRAALDEARAAGRVVGLVPTMGALHRGHTSLVERARAECDVVAVSIFVNPLQFGDPEDIARYPRTLERDLAGVRGGGGRRRLRPDRRARCTPRGPPLRRRRYRCVASATSWEGASRPGHFDGVATVVAKLFTIAGPCRAYFGLKDFQQLAVVRRMASELSLPVEVIGCPIVRESDGLALSSRNVRLSATERAGRHRPCRRPWPPAGPPWPTARARAPLSPGPCAPWSTPSRWSPRLRRRGRRRHPRRGRLRSAGHDAGSLRLLIAAQVGPVRLIDNSAALAAADDVRAVPVPAERVRQLERTG